MSFEAIKMTTHLSRILKGQTNTTWEKQINKRFWSVFSREMFRRMYASYRNRARKWEDAMPPWLPLAKSTIQSKKHRRGKIPPSKHPTWINFDTGKLLASFRPGPASGEQYVPVPNQIWELKPNKLVLGTEVEYSSYVDGKRRLFPKPAVLARWAKESAEVAFRAIAPLLQKTGTEVINGPFNMKQIATQKGLF